MFRQRVMNFLEPFIFDLRKSLRIIDEQHDAVALDTLGDFAQTVDKSNA